MRIVLRTDVEGVGNKGDVLDVADGYARSTGRVGTVVCPLVGDGSWSRRGWGRALGLGEQLHGSRRFGFRLDMPVVNPRVHSAPMVSELQHGDLIALSLEQVREVDAWPWSEIHAFGQIQQ